MANLSNINNKFLFTDGDFLKIGNLAPINNISGTESGISVTNSNVASIALDNTAASGKTFVIYSDDGGKLNFYDVDASSGRLVIDSSGNVGIGTGVPQSLLSLGNAVDAQKLLLYDDNNNFKYGFGIQSNELRQFFPNSATSRMVFGTISDSDGSTFSEKMRIDSSGTVTITNSSSAVLKLQAGTNSSASLRLINDAHDWDVNCQTNDKFAIYSHTDATERLVILPTSGNVGIGADSPSSKLEIAAANSQVRLTDTDDSKFVLYSYSGGKLIVRNNSVNTTTNQFTLTEDGKFGIGTISPSQQLELGGILSPALKLSSTTTNGGVIIFNVAGADKGFFGSGYHLGTGSSNDTAMRGEGDLVFLSGGNNQRMRITSTGAISVGSSGTAYGTAGQVLTSNGNASPSWQAAGGGSAWPQEKFAEYTINSTTSNILVATMNSTTWHGNYLSGCLKFTMSTSDYVQVTYVPVSTFLSAGSKYFFKGTEMTSKNNGSNAAKLVFTFAGDQGTYGSTCTLKINRNQNESSYIKVNVLVQAISNPNMFILN